MYPCCFLGLSAFPGAGPCGDVLHYRVVLVEVHRGPAGGFDWRGRRRVFGLLDDRHRAERLGLDCYWVGSLDFCWGGNQGVFH